MRRTTGIEKGFLGGCECCTEKQAEETGKKYWVK